MCPTREEISVMEINPTAVTPSAVSGATFQDPKAELPFRLVKTEVLPLTFELVQQFKTMEGSPTEREVNPARCKYLYEKFAAGHLIPFLWCIADLNGKKYRMNGQHSSTVLAQMDGMFPKNGTVLRSEFSVKDKEGLAYLFRQFDDRKSARTPADVSGAYQGLYDEVKDVNRASAKAAIEGAAWYRRVIEGVPTPTGDDQYGLFAVRALDTFVHWASEIFSIKTPEMMKLPVIGAMYGTFTTNEAEAKPFWEEVARGGDQYDESAPSSVVDAWLKEIKTERLNLKPGQIYQGCIYAWNAHRSDRTLSKIKFDAKTMPNISA